MTVARAERVFTAFFVRLQVFLLRRTLDPEEHQFRLRDGSRHLAEILRMMRRLPGLPVRVKFGLVRFHPTICTQNALRANHDDAWPHRYLGYLT